MGRAGRRFGPGWRRSEPSREKEQELIKLLRSDSPAAEKAIACKQLAVHGSPEAVPELALLLTDERLASWARIALEAIPGPAADEALRKAMNSLDGKLLIGTINSIGVRRDQRRRSIDQSCRDQDAEVASLQPLRYSRAHRNSPATKTLRAIAGRRPRPDPRRGGNC